MLDSNLLVIFADKTCVLKIYMLRWRKGRLKYEGVQDRALKLYPVINSSFDEGHFGASEKHGVIGPYLKKIGLDVNDLSNYHPLTNLTHLSKIIEQAMLDQLVPFLEEVGVVPR